MTSHKDCTHPATKAGRSACRKGSTAAPSTPRVTPTKVRAAKAKAETIINEAIASKCQHLSRDSKGLCATCGDQLSELNTRRLQATRAKAAAAQGPRGECHICGGKAGWTDNKSNSPVCMKHVDYDNCRIIAL